MNQAPDQADSKPAVINNETQIVHTNDAEQLRLFAQSFMPGANQHEVLFFAEVCNRMALDPFRREIHAVKRRSNVGGQWVEKWTFQTGIDGYRKRAEQTGRYAGSTTTYDVQPETATHPNVARTIVRKILPNGQIGEFEGVARWVEYVQTGKNGPNAMWAKMPFVMLAKCSEGQALRKAFPTELSGIFVDGELMNQEPPTQTENIPVTYDIAAVQDAVEEAGISPERFKKWAIERKHINPDQELDELPQPILNYIPGHLQRLKQQIAEDDKKGS